MPTCPRHVSPEVVTGGARPSDSRTARCSGLTRGLRRQTVTLSPQHGVRITESLADSSCFSGEVALDQALKDKENKPSQGSYSSP